MNSLSIFNGLGRSVNTTIAGVLGHKADSHSLDAQCNVNRRENTLNQRSSARQTPVKKRKVAPLVDQEVTSPNPEEVLNKALNTQRKIREELGERSPAELVLGLPRQNILEAQFHKDPKGTYKLLRARVAALKKDIDATFSYFGRKNQALKKYEVLKKELKTLSVDTAKGVGEKSLRPLLEGIRDYEETFNKDSWLEKATIAFMGTDSLLKGEFSDRLKALIPQHRLALGDRHLLDPRVVSKDNIGYVISDAKGLKAFTGTVMEASITETFNRQLANTLSQLPFDDFPDQTVIADPVKLINYLAERHPKLVYELIASEITRETFSQDPKIRSAAQEELAWLKQGGAEHDVLTKVMENNVELQHFLGIQIQHKYADTLAKSLFKFTQTAFDDQEPEAAGGLQLDLNIAALPIDQYTAFTEKLKFGLKLAGTLRRQDLIGKLYTLNPQVEMVKAIPLHKVITSGELKGERLWHLDKDLTPEQVTAALIGGSGHPCEKAIRALGACLALSAPKDLLQMRHSLKMKDKLLTAQQNRVLEQAREAIGKPEAFEAALNVARTIEQERPNYQLIAEDNITPMQRLNRAGRVALIPDRQPLEQQVRALMLEHQLTLGGYDFKTELYNLLTELPCFSSVGTTASKISEKAAALFDDYQKGTLSTPHFVWAMIGLGGTIKNDFARQFQEVITGAAAIGKVSPQTLRALSGNFSQTLQNLSSSVGGHSTLYTLFNEIHARVAGETRAQYFLDEVQHNGTNLDIDKLNKNERAAVHRLITINALLSGCKYVPAIAEGVLNTATTAVTPFNVAWNTASTAAKLCATYMIGDQVNRMNSDDLKIANATLDILHDGQTIAAHRQQMMARSGSILADIATRQSGLATAVKGGVLYPFKILGRGIADAFRDLRHGKPGAWAHTGLMLLKAAPAVIAPVAAIAALFTAPIGIALVGIPMALWASWSWAEYMVSSTGLVDIATLAVKRAQEITQDKSIDFTKAADKILKESGEEQRTLLLAKRRAYAGIYAKHWERWASDNQQVVESINQEIKDELKKIDHSRLLTVTQTLRYLANTDDIAKVSNDELRRHLPANEADNIPEQGPRRDYWAIALTERLRYELYSATGSDEVPETDEQLLQRTSDFTAECLRGLHLVANDTEASQEYDHCCTLHVDQITLHTQGRMANFLAKVMTRGLQTVFTRRARASGQCVKKQMNPDIFARRTQLDEDLQQALRNQFVDVFTAEMKRANQVGQSHLKTQLAANGIDLKDKEISTLQAPATGG